MNNPFVILPYASKELFCDRKAELETLVNFVENNTNITFISPRRIGKTGLIYRLFDEISEKKLPLLTFYVDISSSQNVADFNKL
ncbi:MAG: ATP-binding protein, partial [Paludibacteraceae bacterium]|nr:ATP-binding protein [Paludibacteraceae bacterium]